MLRGRRKTEKKKKLDVRPSFVCGVVVHGATISLPGHNEHERMRRPVPNRLQRSGLRESRSCRVQCNRVVRASRIAAKACAARSIDGGEEYLRVSMD